MGGEIAVGIVREASRALVAVAGELDMATVPTLEARLEEAAGKGLDIALDLHALNFIDASGLRALLRAKADAREQGRRFEIVSQGAPLTRLLAITGAGAQLTRAEA